MGFNSAEVEDTAGQSTLNLLLRYLLKHPQKLTEQVDLEVDETGQVAEMEVESINCLELFPSKITHSR